MTMVITKPPVLWIPLQLIITPLDVRFSFAPLFRCVLPYRFVVTFLRVDASRSLFIFYSRLVFVAFSLLMSKIFVHINKKSGYVILCMSHKYITLVLTSSLKYQKRNVKNKDYKQTFSPLPHSARPVLSFIMTERNMQNKKRKTSP